VTLTRPAIYYAVTLIMRMITTVITIILIYLYCCVRAGTV